MAVVVQVVRIGIEIETGTVGIVHTEKAPHEFLVVFAVGILSNAKQKRIESFVAGFPAELKEKIYYVFGAGKPLKKGFIKLCADAGLEPGQAAMVGDQLFTDIFGGNRSGLTTILVKPIDPSIEPPFVRFKRFFERPFL